VGRRKRNRIQSDSQRTGGPRRYTDLREPRYEISHTLDGEPELEGTMAAGSLFKYLRDLEAETAKWEPGEHVLELRIRVLPKLALSERAIAEINALVKGDPRIEALAVKSPWVKNFGGLISKMVPGFCEVFTALAAEGRSEEPTFAEFVAKGHEMFPDAKRFAGGNKPPFSRFFAKAHEMSNGRKK
jgi:hypothetical protein